MQIRLRRSVLTLREGRRICVSLLGIQVQCVLFVEIFLLLRGRIRTGDIKLAILQKVIVGIAAAQLAPAYELLVALREQRQALVFR